MKKYDIRPTLRVQCGSLTWKGKANSVNEAIIAALCNLPENPSLLLRVHNGQVWEYIDFKSALKIAGYSVKKTKNGFTVL